MVVELMDWDDSYACEKLDPAYGQSRIARDMTRANTRSYVARHDGAVRAYLVADYRETPPRVLRVAGSATAARLLLDKVRQVCRDSGREGPVGEADEGDAGAIALYRAGGWVGALVRGEDSDRIRFSSP